MKWSWKQWALSATVAFVLSLILNVIGFLSAGVIRSYLMIGAIVLLGMGWIFTIIGKLN